MTSKPLTLAFDEFGDPSEQPLIILHGFFASSRNWRSIAKTLSKKYHVYVPDLRNHGVSPHSTVMDYPAMAADLLCFLDRHGLERAHLLGHSMGGKVAMWLALNAAGRIDKLVIADISPTRYDHSFDQTIEALKSLPLHAISNRKEAEALLSETINDAGYRQFLLQNLQLQEGEYQWRVDLDIFFRTADNIISFPDADSLSSYPDVALFLGGESSNYIHSDDVYHLFPKAHIETIPGTGHWLHVQAPERFCREVAAFLA